MTSTARAEIDPAPDAAAGPPPGARARRGPGRPFWRLFHAATISGAGDGIRQGALPLLAAVLVPEPGAVAAVWFAGGLPFLLVGPIAGVLTDRWSDRRRMMFLADLVAAAAMLLFALAVLAGTTEIALLVAANFVLGSIQTVRDNAELAIVPELVGPATLDTANGRLQGARLLTIDVAGPPLGALLFAVAAGLPFVVDAVSFGLAALLVRGIAVRRRRPLVPSGSGRTGSSVLGELGVGLRWLWRHRALRVLCLLVGLTNLAVMTTISIAVLYAFEVLHVGRVQYGLLLGMVALGGVLGSLLVPALSRWIGRGPVLRLALGLAPVAFLAAALTSDAIVAAAALTGVGVTVAAVNILSASLRQLLVPADLIGRVNSSYRLVAVGLAPVGAVLGGVTAQLFGLRAPFITAAVVLAVAWLLTLPTLTNRMLTPPDPDAAAPAEPARIRRRGGWARTGRVLRRVLVGLVVAVILLVAGTAGYVSWTVRRSFPTVAGRLPVAGLHGPVDVTRDAWGVPQVYAGDPHDLFLAQGYVHAQDRFWEMDVRRHITAGRLAELFGADLVPTDAVVRTLGWYRVAQEELTLLSPATREYLQAYADGVNAYLADHTGPAASLEYGVLALVTPGYRPEPWTPADSVSWLKAMAWDLRTNLGDEIQRALLAAKLPAAMIDELYPPYDFARQRPIVTTPDAAAPSGPVRPAGAASTGTLRGGAGAIGQLAAVLGPGGAGIGSNSWVVAGSRTTTGKPLLANDPHLGPAIPGVWYQMGLHCRTVGASCPFDVSGFGFAGMPAVVIGHNADIAWGLTNLGADVTDLFIEHLRDGSYERQGRWVPVRTRPEQIRVAGGATRTITVRATEHGPIVSDVLDKVRSIATVDPSDALALRWTALDPGNTMDSLFAVDRASDWASFRSAAADFTVPAQNMVYADRAGHIGYQAPGRIPIRKAGDGRYPVPGWTGAYDWIGFIPFEALPTAFDPPSGYVVTANNAAVGPAYPYLLTKDWADGYRSTRIAELLATAGPVDVAAMQRIQLDDRNPFAATLTPYLLAVPAGGSAARARDLLRGWDGGQPVDSAPAAYFNAVWRHLLRLTFTDELSGTAADPDPDGGGRWFEVVGGLLTQPDNAWWRNATDPRGLHSRDDVLRAALDDAAAELTGRLGADPARWRWGALHRLTLTHQTLGSGGPQPVRRLFNRGPYPLAGGSAAVNANGWDARDGYAVDWGPSMRMVVDLADLDRSRWINQTGASGHAYADNYNDQAELWATGRTVPWPSSGAAVQAAATHRLALVPAAGGSGP
jgi:penicillin amidase